MDTRLHSSAMSADGSPNANAAIITTPIINNNVAYAATIAIASALYHGNAQIVVLPI